MKKQIVSSDEVEGRVLVKLSGYLYRLNVREFERCDFYRASERTYRHGVVPQGGWLRAKVIVYHQEDTSFQTFHFWYNDITEKWFYLGCKFPRPNAGLWGPPDSSL